MSRFDELTQVVRRLRGEDGCPWDRAQTPLSMRPYLLEECYEVLDAIDRGDRSALSKELGDLLFVVVMIAQMASEEGAFHLDEVLEAVTQKMVDRHPHVFDPTHETDGREGEVASWEARKAKERSKKVSALDGVPDALPALLRAHRITEKASRVGFDWPDIAGVRDKLDEEINELDDAMAGGDEGAIGDEFGDVLLTLVNLGRFLPVGSEEALRGATSRFAMRFRHVEAQLLAMGSTVHEADLDTLERAWQAAKEA